MTGADGMSGQVLEATTAELVALLAEHRQLGFAPTAEHEWLASRSVLRLYGAGDVVTRKGEQVPFLLVIISGRIVIRADRGAGWHKIMEMRAGDVGGMMPYSRGAKPPSDVIVEEPSQALTMDNALLGELARECPAITAALVHAMVDRARVFKSSDLRDEKLLSLGKLAAGLAHELNNPASAVVRSSRILIDSLAGAESAARLLAGAGLSAAQFEAIDTARRMCEAAQGATLRSSIERADREDELTGWLADHHATEEYAIPLADTEITPAALDLLAESLQGDALEAALGWISACCAVRALTGEIATAATRIHDLVGAVKGFAYMDHAPAPEPVDIRRSLSDTFTMLGAKMRAKDVNVSVELPENLPRAVAVGAELNQVWMNLIDNALDAVPTGGQIDVTASHLLGHVVVEIVDDGPGIPADIKERIFEPFFTTKGVGKGTGLGLDIAKRLLNRYDGEISVESVPGRTAFQVRLPAE
jgi:signal transduction histidine kinase